MTGQKNKKIGKIRTRFAPSPTGTPESIHLGFVIRALWNYAYAKKNNGKFVLRIEDTDRNRSRKDTEAEILRVLKVFGIKWNEGPDIGGRFAPYRQSERLEKYKEAAHMLVEKGYAYYDFDAKVREKEEIKEAYNSETKLAELKVRPKARFEDSANAKKRVENGEPYVVRVKIPDDRVFEYDDWILKKRIKFYGKEISDLILLKSDGFPTYHLAVVVDDIDMQISHVFRGQEWISSTPIHLYLYEGLKHEVPTIGHFSVILDPRTGKKFSKRDMTALFGVKTWLDKGYLPEAILNYLMLLGWAPKDNREFFTLDEFIETFDQDGIQKANPTFDSKKLDWFNGYYIRQKSDEDLLKILKPFIPSGSDEDKVRNTIPLIKERITKLSDFNPLAGFIFRSSTEIEPKIITSNYLSHISLATEALKNVDKWEQETVNQALGNVIQEKGFKTGDFYMDLRGTISGNSFTPPINESILIIGKEETLERLNKGIEKAKK